MALFRLYQTPIPLSLSPTDSEQGEWTPGILATIEQLGADSFQCDLGKNQVCLDRHDFAVFFMS